MVGDLSVPKRGVPVVYASRISAEKAVDAGKVAMTERMENEEICCFGMVSCPTAFSTARSLRELGLVSFARHWIRAQRPKSFEEFLKRD